MLGLRANTGISSFSVVIPSVPTGLTLSLISGGVKIDWVSADSIEIWGKSDSDTYAFLYLISAGVTTKSEAVTPVDLRYYKVRAKNIYGYSDFCAEQSIALLGAEKINQSTWYTSTWWNSRFPDPPFTTVGSTIAVVNTANDQCIRATATFIVGKKYKISITHTRAGGTFCRLGDDTVYVQTTVTGTQTATVVATSTIMRLSATAYVGSITGMSCKEILMP